MMITQEGICQLELFINEELYQKEIITEDEYRKVNDILRKKIKEDKCVFFK